jgi:hypothetical protein
LPERRFHLNRHFLIARVEVRFPVANLRPARIPPFKGVLLTQEASFVPPDGLARPPFPSRDPDRNVTGGASNAMPPDPQNAVVARLQIPFAELFDIAIRFLSEQTRCHVLAEILQRCQC